MIFSEIQTVLILAPHPDDAEFGLGGTIARLKELKKDVHVVIFSLCEKSTPEGFEIGSIEQDMYASLNFLNFEKENIHVLGYPVREFPKMRQEILEDLIQLKKKINPDMVFLPCSSDIHQDHEVIHKEGIRAFKYANLLGYEMPWNNFGFTSFVYVKLEAIHIKKKIDALDLYKTQKHRSYGNESFVKSLAKLRGTQIQEDFAESFELIRLIQK